MGKRGSLSLSINAIVVLILAITMLGLGLGFMRSSFGGVTDQFGQVTDEMKQSMIDRMKDDVSDVMLNAYEVEMKPTDEKTIYLAIKNSDSGAQEFYAYDGGSDSTGIWTVVPMIGSPAGTITVKAFPKMIVDGSSIDVFPVKIVSAGRDS